MPITYPRPCPTCGKKYKNIFDFSRHRKYCGTNVKVPCLHCDKMFSRKDAMKVHVKMSTPNQPEGKLLTMMNYFAWSYFIPAKYLA